MEYTTAPASFRLLEHDTGGGPLQDGKGSLNVSRTNGEFDAWRAEEARRAVASFNAGFASREAAESRPEGLILAGVAVTYDRPHPADGQNWRYESFATGCFKSHLQLRKTNFHRMHFFSHSFGWTDNGSLQLVDAPDGLLFKLCIDQKILRGAELFDEVRAGILPEMSVGFFPTDWDITGSGDRRTRVITEARLGEISAVTIGAVPGTKCVAIDGRHARIDVRGWRSAAEFRAECANAGVLTAFGLVRDLLK